MNKSHRYLLSHLASLTFSATSQLGSYLNLIRDNFIIPHVQEHLINKTKKSAHLDRKSTVQSMQSKSLSESNEVPCSSESFWGILVQTFSNFTIILLISNYCDNRSVFSVIYHF